MGLVLFLPSIPIAIRSYSALFLVAAAIFIISLSIGVVSNYDVRDLFRDAFYISVFPLYLAIGMAIAGRGLSRADRDYILVFSCIVVGHIAVTSLGLGGELTREAYRRAIGYAAPLSLVAIPFGLHTLLSGGRSGSRWLAVAALVAAGLAVPLTGSRTQLVFSIFALFSYAFSQWRPLMAAALTALLLAIIFFGTPLFTLFVGDSDQRLMVDSLPTVISEWIPYGYTTDVEINTRWRAYEGFAAFSRWASASPEHQVFGLGMGARVPLGLAMRLGSEVFTDVPTFHNGLMFALVKMGLLGIVYVATCFAIALALYRHSDASRLYLAIAAMSLTYLILGTPTIGGIFNGSQQGTIVMLFLGVSLGSNTNSSSRR